MRSRFHHEEIYRGKDLLAKLSKTKILVCGAGAIGSNLVDNLTRQGFSNISVLDMDRIETHNLNTQVWADADVGGLKSDVLKNKVFRNVGIEIESFNKELSEANVTKFFKKIDLVVDAFDNSKSRQLIQNEVRKKKMACIHAGLHADYGEVVWDESYTVPKDVGGDVCDYPLARNLILMVVAVLSEEILGFVLNKGQRRNLAITLKDLKVSSYR